MDFGKRLKESRIKTGLSQEELAYQINERTKGSIRRNTISNYENNVSRPDFKTLKAIAEILETSLDIMLETQVVDLKSFVAESQAEYSSSKTLTEAKQTIHDIEKTLKSTVDENTLSELLNKSIQLNKHLLEHSGKLYRKNKQAIEFINKGLDLD